MQDVIDKFIEMRELALVGVSRSKNKWGNALFRSLKKKGYTVYPVNPHAKEILGEKCFSSVIELPHDVENIIITVPSQTAKLVVKECASAGIKRIWLHSGVGGEGSQSEEAIRYCKDRGVEIIYDFCPLMFFPPVGVHKVHLWFKKLFRNFPPEYQAKH